MLASFAAGNSVFQQLHHFRMHAPVATGKDRLAIAAIISVPGCDDTARAFHHWNQRRDVPAIETSFDDDVDEAQRERGEEVAIAAIARHACRRSDPLESG